MKTLGMTPRTYDRATDTYRDATGPEAVTMIERRYEDAARMVAEWHPDIGHGEHHVHAAVRLVAEAVPALLAEHRRVLARLEAAEAALRQIATGSAWNARETAQHGLDAD